MINFTKQTILLRAMSRMSPRMAGYMARRVARNQLVPRFAAAYHRRLDRIKSQLPALMRPDAVLPGLHKMAAFYSVEYQDIIDDVVKGRFRLHGREVDFGSPENTDWNLELPEEGNHQMWRVKLAHMGYLAPMMLQGNAVHHTAVAELVRSARAGANPAAKGAFNGFWFPYAASHRILSIGSALLVARHHHKIPAAVDAEVVDFLRANVAFVLDNVEHELCNNHVERNLAALCLYFSYAGSVPPALAAKLERDITHLIDKTILDDGCQIERSPMYQGLSLASLGIMAETPFLSAALRTRLEGMVESSAKAFAVLCGPDGEVALFNDAWHGEVPRWDGAPAPDGRTLLPDGGYGRLSLGDDMCLMDAGALGPRWNPGHGHADFLAVELTLAGHRLAVDPGTSRYNSGAERARERAAASHNGPVWHGHEPVNFFGCFKVGKTAEAHLISAEKLPDDCIAGVFTSDAGPMGRMLRHYPGQGYLIADLWQGVRVKGQVSWLLPDEWAPTPGESGRILMQHTSGARALLEPLVSAGQEALRASHWTCHYGRLDPAVHYTTYPRIQGDQQQLLTWIGHGAAPDTAIADGDTLFRHLGLFSRNGH